MDNNYKLGKIEAVFAISIIMVNRIILNLPYAILENTGTGSIINLIYIGFIGFLIVLIVNKLFKFFPNSDIIDISEYLGGKFLKIIVSIIFIALFLLTLFTTIIDFTNLLKVVYFHESPLIFILLFFIFALLISNLIGFRAITKTISLIVPFTIISILFTFFAVYDTVSLDKFTPILGNGYESIFINGLTNLFSFSIIVFFFFFKPLLKNSYDFEKITISSFIISWILLFLTIISLLSVFPSSNITSHINFLYSIVRKINLGNFLQRLDALFILLWILCIFSYLSIITFMSNTILKKVTSASNRSMFSYLIAIILLGLCLIPINIAEIKFMQSTVYKYAILIITSITILLLLFANIKFNYLRRRGGLNAKKMVH